MEAPHREERWIGALFFALALLYLVPFWIVHYLPTVDGPCHTYNAWILLHYGDSREYPLFRQYYEINAEPYPNWIGHGIMVLLMLVAPPLVAEKVLVSLYALAFLGGLWYFAGSVRPGSRWLAFLGFPFVFNSLFQFGFYNFSISLALFLWVLGFWWRHRDRPGDLRYVVGINLLLGLCYFSHILSFGLSLVAIAVLWLATLRRDNWRLRAGHVAVLAPQGYVAGWYRLLSRDMAEYLAGLDGVRPNSRVLPLLFDHQARGSRLDPLNHAIGYKALERGLIDWDNYEATTTTQFPTHFRESAPMPDTGEIEASPGRLRMKVWKRRADYVYTWRMPPDHPFKGRLERFYKPVSSTGPGVLWERREEIAPEGGGG